MTREQEAGARPAPVVSPAVGIRRLAHCGIYVSDLDATRNFYVGVLGMHEVPRPSSFTFPGTWFACNDAQIHAIVELSPGRVREYAEIRPQGKELLEGFWPHLSLEVANVEVAQEAVEQRGVVIVGGPIVRSDGVKQFYILDPDGYMVELWSQSVEAAPP